jgi:antitoxin ParD1/3/4
MIGNTPIVFEHYCASFVEKQVHGGYCGRVGDGGRSRSKLLNENDSKVTALQDALNAGRESGESRSFHVNAFLRRMRARHEPA